MNWFRAFLIAVTTTLATTAIGSPTRATYAQDTCLHGPSETADQAARRQAALGFTRHVNTMQAQTSVKANTYVALRDLPLTRPVPDGFNLKLTTDGASYSFSVIDGTDPCRLGYFSNDAGVIYRGEALR